MLCHSGFEIKLFEILVFEVTGYSRPNKFKRFMVHCGPEKCLKLSLIGCSASNVENYYCRVYDIKVGSLECTSKFGYNFVGETKRQLSRLTPCAGACLLCAKGLVGVIDQSLTCQL